MMRDRTEYHRQYYLDHKEASKESATEWRKAHPKQAYQHRSKWNRANAETMTQATNAYWDRAAAKIGMPGTTLRGRIYKLRGRLVQESKVCTHCKGAENLEIHHIKPVRTHPHMALDESNIVVLCHACHVKVEGKNPI